MSYKVDTIFVFDKQTKRLSKKYPSLKKDLAALIKSLAEDPEQRKPLGNNFLKYGQPLVLRIKVKSGGARIIAYVKITTTTVLLTSIYDKFEKTQLIIRN